MRNKLLLIIFLLIGGMRSHAQIYTTTTPVTGLQYPVAFTFAPDGRYFITLKSGIIRVHDANGAFMNVFYNLSDSTYDDFERGLLGIEVDPDFQNNHYVYAYYNHRYPLSSGAQSIRIVRFTDVNNVGTNPTVILSIPVSNTIPGNHVGGNLRFRPSEPDKIYLSIGELATTSYAQTLANPFGKVLRINSNGTIPSDNPYYDDGNPATGNDDRIWTYGHRNPFDLCFSPVNDSLYISENGSTSSANGDDEVNLGIRGKNYGWPSCEGFHLYNSSNNCTNAAYTDPVTVFPPVSGSLPAITGILFYSSQVMPEFDNHLLVADNDIGRISDVTLGNAPVYDVATSNVVWFDVTASGGLTTLKQGADGCIYAMKGGYTTTGNISRICPQGLNVSEAAVNNISLTASPNPFSGITEIAYYVPVKDQVTITISDIAGRKIADLVNEVKSEGNHTLALDAAKLNLKPGSYFCTLKQGEVWRTVKVMVK
jgi:glucose/arabinose dehydrogenase